MPDGLQRETRTVMVTRSPQGARDWIEAIAARGVRVAAREVFTVESMTAEARVQRAIDGLSDYAWILLTSRNGLHFLHRAVQSRGIHLASLEARFGAVGPQTAIALEALGVGPVAVGDPAHAAGLAGVLSERIETGQRVLIVRPETSRSELEQGLTACGAHVDAIPFYRNRPAPSIGKVATELVDGRFDAVLFSAPSAVDHLYAACGNHASKCFRSTALIAIGPTTAEALRGQRCDVAATARQPTPESVAEAVAAALES